MDFTDIKLLIMDVDGVLTDGLVFPVPGGTSARVLTGKAFQVRDGWAIKHWTGLGRRAALLTGRESSVVQRRAEELGIPCMFASGSSKSFGYRDLLEQIGCGDHEAAYVGDDIPDLPPMMRCGFPVAVANAAPAVKRVAMYVTEHRGGDGAVAEVIEFLLRRQGCWSQALRDAIEP